MSLAVIGLHCSLRNMPDYTKFMLIKKLMRHCEVLWKEVKAPFLATACFASCLLRGPSLCPPSTLRCSLAELGHPLLY